MRMMLAWLASAAALVCQPTVAATTYQVTYLPEALTPMGINNAQTVLGSIESQGRTVFTWTAEQGLKAVPGLDIGAAGINDLGVVVGSAPGYLGDSYVSYPRVVTPDGVVRTLPNYTATEPNSLNGAVAINNQGQVAGYLYHDVWTGSQAVRWEADGRITRLGGLGYYSYAYDINSQGQVVGYALSQQEGALAFVSDGTSGMTNLGGLPSVYNNPTNWTLAYGINDAGRVVGESGFQGEYATVTTAFIWDEQGGMRALVAQDSPYFGASSASDLNNAGTVVGNVRLGFGQYGGFVWTEEDGLVRLDNLTTDGVAITAAVSINDQGQILAYAAPTATSNWFGRPVILTPVPEPANLATFALGLVALAWLAGHRQRPTSQRESNC